MKRILTIFFSLILLSGLAGCVSKEKQNELLQYINTDVKEMGELETQFLESYKSVTGDKYINDKIMYQEFTTNTLILARKLNDKSVEVGGKLTNEEILSVHKLYMNCCTKYLNVVSMIISALEDQDASQMRTANNILNEANSLAIDYKSQLNTLAQKYNVTIKGGN